MKTKEKILTNELRNDLKEVIQKELRQLPEQLEALEPKERLNVLCQLSGIHKALIYTLHLKEGEPFTFD